MSGQFFTELPTSKSIVYSFPTFNLQYNSEKLSLYTSYNGEINFENLDETYSWQIRESGHNLHIESVERVRQKNLSHKFHYGADYLATSKNIISYYGSVNPYSYEQDGSVTTTVEEDSANTHIMQREERDKNLNIFNTIYYKHLFNRDGQELTIDISNSILKSNNSVSYLNKADARTSPIINVEKPEQIATTIKADLSSPIGENITLNTGMSAVYRSMQNKSASGFSYDEQLYSIYGNLNYKQNNYNLNFGLRTEYSKRLSVLPYLTFQHKINSKQNLLFSYRRSINRPNIFQLNPYTYVDNSFSVRKGNPLLEPEFRHLIYAEHSIRFGINYISYRVFYEKMEDVINNLTSLNNGVLFETQPQNLGEIHNLGIQFSGSLKFGTLAITTSAKLYNQYTITNILAKQYGVSNRQNLVFEMGLTSVLSLKHDFALSGTLQYSTPRNNIQGLTFSDALYIFSLDKTFRENLKVGIMAALPFAKTFAYQQREVNADNFSISYGGNLKLPILPVMFRLRYQFKTGREKSLLKREIDEVAKRDKRGF